MKTRLRAGLGAATIALATTGSLLLTSTPAQAAVDVAGIWSFSEGAGQTAFDYSLSGNNGVLGSTTAKDAQDPERIRTTPLPFLTGLRFDGGDYVRVANAPSLEPTGVTVVARVRADVSPGRYRYVVSKGALACETASYGLYTGDDGNLRFYASDGTEVAMSNAAPASLWDGRWHTVVGTYDAGKVSLSVDRVEIGVAVPSELSIGYDKPDGNDFVIGTYTGPCGSRQLGYVGDLDGVAVVGSGKTSSPWSLVS